jgi:hypothetical protein
MLFDGGERKMFKLYDTAFKVGFCVNILIFTVLNINDYFEALAEDKRLKSIGISFSGSSGIAWGFPYDWIGFGLFGFSVLNIVIIAFCGFILGLIFKFVWSKIAPKKLR